MRICVVGTGYVGLVAGACFSDSGNHVICLDVNEEKINRLKEGHLPIYEPGLDEIVARNVKGDRLTFTTDTESAIAASKVVFIAVGTPSGADGSLDMKYVFSAIDGLKNVIKKDSIIVMKSTVPVGTADKVRERLGERAKEVHVISNPEFLKEGTAVNDFFKPERVVIGGQSDVAMRRIADLYAPYIRQGNPVLLMSNRSAEMAKYAANTFLAMKISFVNELAMLCERIGANIHDVRKGLITDSRIGNKFLYPGCGYGGSCFPKDVQALIALGKEAGMDMNLYGSIHDVNQDQKKVVFNKINKHYSSQTEGKTVAIWGMAFKPQTDDMREAPAVTLINQLLESGCKVRAYDPVSNGEAKKIFDSRIELFNNPYDATKGADALAIMTEWQEFRSPDFDLLQDHLSDSVIFDGRNLYRPESVVEAGFTYYCIGKPDPIL